MHNFKIGEEVEVWTRSDKRWRVSAFFGADLIKVTAIEEGKSEFVLCKPEWLKLAEPKQVPVNSVTIQDEIF